MGNARSLTKQLRTLLGLALTIALVTAARPFVGWRIWDVASLSDPRFQQFFKLLIHHIGYAFGFVVIAGLVAFAFECAAFRNLDE